METIRPPHHWQLTIDANDPALLVAFWAPTLGYEPMPPPSGHATWNDYYRSVGVPDDELDSAGDGTDRIRDPAGRGPDIWFQIVPERKSDLKNRLHLDVYVADRAATYEQKRDLVLERVAALEARGASAQRTTDDPDNARYAVRMHDPEGNEFCVS